MIGPNATMADACTPLIWNAWYVAATSDEIGEELKERYLLGRSVLLYRTRDGHAVALDNRCPHRSFPLSNGSRDGDNVVCGYHGMTFDQAGRCVLAPSLGRALAGVTVQSFAVVERHPLVWIWMGDPASADENDIPVHDDLSSPNWRTISGYFHVEANYVGLHENLQDLSHFEYLHRSSIGAADRAPADVTVDDRPEGVFMTRVQTGMVPPLLWRRLLTLKDERLTRTIRESFVSPALCTADTTISVDGQEDAHKYNIRLTHFVTPESQDTTHYFWFLFRNFMTEDDGVSDLFHDGISAAFLEDKIALESIAKLVRNDDRSDFKELSFPSDRPGVLLRKRIAEFAAKEHHAEAVSFE
jgi:phenylpropionate dioxygenase-like ring-hydroxylating dioxygenase large terminal subunit